MAISRLKTWTSQEVVSNTDLNGEFNNIINNARSLVSPLTGSLDMDGNELFLDGDADTSIIASTDDRIDFKLSGVASLFRLDGTVASPVNGLNIIAGATGTRVVIDAGITGADANVGLTLLASGTGPVVIDNDTDPVALRFNGAAGAADNNVVQDTNGNEVLTFRATASAVNHLRITNVAAAGTPSLTATGDDTNISLNLVTTGTGTVQANAVDVVTTSGTQTLTNKTLTSPVIDTQVTGTAVATQAQMETGTSTAVIVTPGRAQYHPGVSKGWLRCDTGGTINASYGVSSITDQAVGRLTVSWSTAFSSSSYCVVATVAGTGLANINTGSAQATGTVDVDMRDFAGTLTDFTHYHIAAFGDQ